MRVKVLSRREVEAGGAEDADAAISIRPTTVGRGIGPDARTGTGNQGESVRLLKLVSDDIGVLTYDQFTEPTMDQVSDAIGFGRSIVDGRNLFDRPAGDPLIVVHCEHGRSRSAAIALSLLADHLGAGNEREAVSALMRSDLEGCILTRSS